MFYVGTDRGLIQWDENQQHRRSIGLEGKCVTGIAVAEGYIGAVVKDGRVWEKRSGAWEATPIAKGISVQSLLIMDSFVYAGTEPARIFRKRFNEKEWEAVAALDILPLAARFHTPGGGPACVRTMAAKSAKQFYLDIHVGGIMRTRDSGKTWEAVNEGLEEDVHQVATHRLRPDRIYAATADGFYLSEDEGRTWERRNHGLDNLYARSIAVHPQNPDIVLLSASPSPPPRWRQGGPQFALFRSEDAGGMWRKVTAGLPQPSPSVIDTNGIGFSQERHNMAVCALRSGELFVSQNGGVAWEKAADLGQIYSVCYGQPV